MVLYRKAGTCKGGEMEYVDKLQKLTKPITKLVLDSLSFYDFGGGNDQYNFGVITTHLTRVELEQLIYEYKISNKWQLAGFIEWCSKLKGIPIYPIKADKVNAEEC
jgi:hypothetical protein